MRKVEIEKKKKIIFVLGILLLVGSIAIYMLFFTQEEELFLLEEDNLEEEQNVFNQIMVIEIEEPKEITVHIMGQVHHPGIVCLPEKARIVDAIEAAGGATEQADFTDVNLAYILEDGEKIYIPSQQDKEKEAYVTKENGEAIVTGGSNKEQTNEENVMVNLNTATVEELKKLPGIGESTAIKIINYRKENGNFKTIEDIKNVSGIGDAKFNGIKDNIYVN